MSQKRLPVLESVQLADLKPHPRNYRTHPDDEIEEIQASIREHGWYRNIVIARDDTILAGHGVVEAAIKMGRRVGPAIRLKIDPLDPRALKVLVGDNELGNLAESDNRVLTELLRDLAQDANGLLGTGYDADSYSSLLANLQGDWTQADTQAEWKGMPEFTQNDETGVRRLIVHFATQEDVSRFCELIGQSLTDKTRAIWFPEAERSIVSDRAYVDE